MKEQEEQQDLEKTPDDGLIMMCLEGEGIRM